LGGYLEHSGVFEWDEGATELEGVRMSAGMFPVLGIRPALGRWFTEEEDRIGGPRAVMLYNGLWQRRFGGDSSIVGSTVRINDEVHTIVGVMPASFFFLTPDIEYSVPLREDEVLKDLGVPIRTRWVAYIEVLGRLKQNTDMVAAERELAAIGHRFEERSVDDFGAGIESMHENVVGGVRFMLLVFLGAVSLVLAIACANVANLALTRATSRQREIALRSALGAGRWRLARHVLTESILVAVMGGAAGLGVAFIGVRTFLALAGDAIPRSYEVTVSGSALLLAAAVSVASGVAFGLLPVLQHRHDRAMSALRAGAGRGGTSGSRRAQVVRQGLVIAQVGIAVVLLTGAGLLVNSFLRLTSVDPGFEPDNVLTASVNLPSSRYATDELVLGFFDDLVARVGGLPGVTRVSTSYSLPFAESNFRQTFLLEGQELSEQEKPWAGTVIVGDGYFQASAVSILRGRGFTRQDRAGAPHVAVVNETMATRHWPGQDAVGKRFRIGRSISGAAASLDRRFFPDDWITVVGVAAAVRRRGLQDEAVAEMYRPHAQMAWPGMSLLVRTAREPEALTAAVQREVWAIDPGLAVTNISTMRQLMDRSIATPRLRTTLLTAFAFVAAFLAMIGVYGVMALSVAQQRQEIGIRMALGASKPTVVAEVLWRGLRVTVVGIALGLVVAVAGARVLSAMLFEITAHDPLTFGAVVVSLALVAALACYIPARRASRVDPLIALREE
jgi:putative ABC transport system permease protein